MRKIISLFTLLVLAQAADISDIYGDWWEVAFYPVSRYIPLCIRFTLSKSTEEVKCTYADGRNPTLVQANMISEIERITGNHWAPMMMVDTAAEVMPALNISLKCGDQDMRDRAAVVRLVNKDYFILYSNIKASKEHTRSEVEPNSAILFARNLVSADEFATVIASIEELKNRNGAKMCGKENYSGF